MKPDAKQFPVDAAQAVANTVLRNNLNHSLGIIRERRDASFDALVDATGLQHIGHAIKQESLSRLPELLEQLEAALTARGIQVHWAETTAEANEAILAIARRRGVKRVVKGKTMVSEETELNPFLESHGIEVIETDLGEYIVQLAEQPPSHIIVPAIHMNRQQVGELFHEKLNEPFTADVKAITAMARRVLRDKFKHADMGITGVNFAVAETGTLCLVENEGNGRMSTTVPPVHVVMMGLEKVIANLSDLPTLLRLLCRSATGQSISTYVNWITSPRRPGEKDGPEEVHVVILDNGRSAIYGDGELRETLACLRCGACLNICPVYNRIGGHAYGSIYAGPIGKILTPQMAGLQTAGHLAGASSLCGACYEVCPVKIPISNLLLRLRQEGNQPTPAGRAIFGNQAGAQRSGVEAMVWKGWRVIHSRPAAYRALTRLTALAGALAPEKSERSLLDLLPFKALRAWRRERRLPRPSRRSLHDLLRDRPSA